MNGEDSINIPDTPENLEHKSAISEDPQWIDNFVKLIETHQTEEIQIRLNEFFPADIGAIFDRIDEEHRFYLISLMDRETQGLVLIELDERYRNRILSTIPYSELTDIIREMESDEARYLLSDLPLNTISEILSRMPLLERINITELLSYPESTAGAIMSKEFVAVMETDTVKKAIQTIRRSSKEIEDIYTVFVTDSDGKYRGHVELSRLILANQQTRVKRIMDTELIPVPVHMDQEEVANFFTRYDFITAPVIDERGVMLGRITVDDILEVIQEEASEDILRMGGVGGEETLNTPVFRASFRRVVWLIVNLGTAFISASVVSLFESTISKVVVLAALMPIVAGLGGSAGGQTMAVIVRNIALGELGYHNTRTALLRELTLGILNGLILGSVAGSFVYFFTGETVLSFVIAAAILMNLVIAAGAGTMVPLILKHFNVDPALASSIFVQATTDILGFLLFLGLATLTLPFIM